MRLLLLVGLTMGVCVQAQAQEGEIGTRGEAGLSIYSNDDALTVISPWARARQRVSDDVDVGVEWTADVISAASVDVVSAATHELSELRNEVGADAHGEWGMWQGTVGYIGSFERDAHAHLMRLAGQVELLQRNLALGVSYGFGYDLIGQSREPFELWRNRTAHLVDLSASQVLSPTTVGVLTYSLQYQGGYLASPYRRVPLMPRDPAEWRPTEAQWTAERHPDARGRHAIGLEVRQALGSSVFLSGKYRGYLDTWSMRSQAGELGVVVDASSGVTIEISDRFYAQSRASFFRGIYTVNRDYITRDRRLAGQLSNYARLGVRYRRGWLEVLARGEFQWTRYEDFWELRDDRILPYEDVLGWIAQVGVRIDL